MNSDEERRVKAVELAISTRASDDHALDATLLLNKAEQIDAFLVAKSTIDGLFVQMSGEDLAQHLFERSLHHNNRAATYAVQADSLEDSQDIDDTTLSNNPVQSLRQSQSHHQSRAEYFAFMSERVTPGATYKLSDGDLTRLELIGRHL
jgi:hypothetical protein